MSRFRYPAGDFLRSQLAFSLLVPGVVVLCVHVHARARVHAYTRTHLPTHLTEHTPLSFLPLSTFCFFFVSFILPLSLRTSFSIQSRGRGLNWSTAECRIVIVLRIAVIDAVVVAFVVIVVAARAESVILK